MLSFTVGLTISPITSSIALSMMRPTPNHSPLIVSTPARSETPSTTSFVTEPSVPLLSSNYFPLDNVSSSESVRGTSRFLPLRPRRREAWRAFQSGAECGPWEYARRQSSHRLFTRRPQAPRLRLYLKISPIPDLAEQDFHLLLDVVSNAPHFRQGLPPRVRQVPVAGVSPEGHGAHFVG